MHELETAARTGAVEKWTINQRASPGDLATFYMVGPVSSFVATGIVTENSTTATKKDGWPGHSMAHIEGIRILAAPIPLKHVREKLPQWGWLRFPRRSTTVPPEHMRLFMSMLTGTNSTMSQDLSAVEGMLTEVTRLVRKRDRNLVEAARRSAAGVCCTCRRDFSKLLDGKGERVLQVHHRKQMSAFDRPHITTLKDLAVVCANCHMLLHVNPKKATSVERLRRMLDTMIESRMR